MFGCIHAPNLPVDLSLTEFAYGYSPIVEEAGGRTVVIDVDAYLGLLAVDGTLVNVGAPAEPLSLNVFSLIGARRSYAGSMIGGIRDTQEMLDFCAEHKLAADVELISAEKINEAYERVLASDVRYRFVIDTATLG